jgi:hypothetical protein
MRSSSNGGVHDRPKQPVRLRDRPRVLGVAVLLLVVPMPHRALGDVPQPHLPEGRHEVQLERAHVRSLRGRPQWFALVRSSLGDPLLGVGLEVREPLGRSSLSARCFEGDHSFDSMILLSSWGPIASVFALNVAGAKWHRNVGSDVPRLLPTRGKFADRPEGTAPAAQGSFDPCCTTCARRAARGATWGSVADLFTLRSKAKPLVNVR